MPWEEERTRVEEAKYEWDIKTRGNYVVRNHGPERVSCLSYLTHKQRYTQRQTKAKEVNNIPPSL